LTRYDIIDLTISNKRKAVLMMDIRYKIERKKTIKKVKEQLFWSVVAVVVYVVLAVAISI